MIPKPLDQIKAPLRENLCNGEGYISPTETAALNNVYREAYRVPERPQTYYGSIKPPPPRVNAASTVQLEQELARRKAEERKKKEAEQDKAYKDAKRKSRQMFLVIRTLCAMVGVNVVGYLKVKVKDTGDVFCEEDYTKK